MPRPEEPGERLVRRTRRQLSAVTLLLVAGLLAGVGLATAAVETRLSDASIDRSLRIAATSAIATFFSSQDDVGGTTGTAASDATGSDESPAATGQGDVGAVSSDDAGARAGGDPSEDSSSAQPRATGSGKSPGPAAPAIVESDDHPPESSDTFFLVLDPSGALISNPRRVSLQGLPDRAAAAAARTAGEDWRTVSDGGIRVRLLTQVVRDKAGTSIGFLQSGFALTLHDEQARELFGTILASSVIGLLGAVLVTLLVTRRALAPIRSAFATERRFVAAASHELRAPVAVIRASAEILQREGLVAAEGRSTVDDVVIESDRLSRLVGDLLALASAEAGAVSLDLQTVDIRTFIAGIAGRAAVMAQAGGAHLIVDGMDVEPVRLATVLVDPDRFTQILMILIDNAIVHSPEGGVVRLVLRFGEADGRPAVTISVVDQGPGVPVAERERIFEPFARLDGRPGTVGGTGLGLAIARLLATRQRAVLRVDDAPGSGAVFSLVLPEAPGSSAA